ncbi:glutamate receptor 2-like [Vespa crabro]|uniref:glutamate receptor 2-like n=1 Tax=Vespa crabro TaxID=7445 RepID=UPI001F02516F|nr:glutamate receptor 2-like [Vespa crabro]
MSLAVWLVIFIYKGHISDYCYNPPGNIFHLRFNSVMLVRCGMENILREWYSIDANVLEINDIATWSLEKGIIKLVPDFLFERRYNLQGLVMRTVALKDTAFVRVKKDEDLDGLFGKILKELSVTLNFSLDIVSKVEEHGRWNARKQSCSGAIAEVHDGRADIALAKFSITHERLNPVDFTIPFFTSKNCLFIRKPERHAIKWTSYFSTFTNSIWIATFGLLIVGSILVAFLFGLIDFSGRSSLRMAYFSIFLLVTVLWATYSAALISFLTSPIRILPFHSLESFVQDGTYQLAVFHGSSYDIFANSQNPLAKKIMKLMLDEEKLPITALEGFERICNNPKLAIYTYDEIKKNIDNKLPCNVIQVGTGSINCLAIILSKHNPFTDIINFQKIILKILRNGGAAVDAAEVFRRNTHH